MTVLVIYLQASCVTMGIDYIILQYPLTYRHHAFSPSGLFRHVYAQSFPVAVSLAFRA